ncbi:hypothetical protein OUZ56_008382 [Daphnia magna]|uniref:Uncharacterized protein n=1 Tax=Daphnia magna TaxID=35525 RepID=A0ABR0ACT5_9CRUS|nr:hypothetical protein OUZ56_008382 [Daphnia magna]
MKKWEGHLLVSDINASNIPVHKSAGKILGSRVISSKLQQASPASNQISARLIRHYTELFCRKSKRFPRYYGEMATRPTNRELPERSDFHSSSICCRIPPPLKASSIEIATWQYKLFIYLLNKRTTIKKWIKRRSVVAPFYVDDHDRNNGAHTACEKTCPLPGDAQSLALKNN